MKYIDEPPQFQHTRTPLMAHQRAGLRKSAGQRHFAFTMQQGTGKTLTLLEEAMRLHAAGEIDCVAVVAQNGLQENWVLNEIPLHVPEEYPMVAGYYVSNPNRREKAMMAEVMKPRAVGDVVPLRLFACNFESLLTDRCFKLMESFIRSGRCMIIADESHNIKNPDARRTRRAISLSKQARYHRISTGTISAGSPIDLFSQYEFAGPGKELLGTDSLVAFRAEYCELLPHGHGLMRHIIARRERALGREMTEREKERYAPPIVERDEHGRPKYKNLEQLQRIIDPITFRVLKEDCLDLPPKVYETRYFHLTREQRAVYERVHKEQRYILEDETVLTMSKLVAMGKLRQITSGFLLLRDGTVSYLEDNPRIQLLLDDIGEISDEQGIIWSQYKEEQRNIERVLRKLGREVKTVNGDTPQRERIAIREAFQAGELQWINAHPATMGTGFTLTRATLNVYYSNGFNMIEREQSEDRSHRIGTVRSVTYRDYVAVDTRDDDVVWAHQHKLDTAAMINGDPARKLRWAPPAE